jgi:hypothetical protein
LYLRFQGGSADAAKVNLREEDTDAIKPSWAGRKDGVCRII